MKKLYKISDFFDEIPSMMLSVYAIPHIGKPNHETGVVDTIEILGVGELKKYVDFNFGERSIYIPETEHPEVAFRDMFISFSNRRGSYYADMIYALKQYYNPIENYNMNEFHSNNTSDTETPQYYTETETHTPTNWQKETTESFDNYKETETLTPDDWKTTETQTPDGWTKESTKNNANNEVNHGKSFYAFNSQNPVPVASENTTEKLELKEEQKGTFETASEQTGTFETAKEITGSKSVTETQSGLFTIQKTKNGSISKSGYESGNLTRSGNIGVTTTQQMLQQEINIKMNDVIKMFVAEFFTTYSIYA